MARVAHDEALAAELTPLGHVAIVHPQVQTMPQPQLRRKLLGQLLASAARDHEGALLCVLECPAVHLFRAGPTAASRRVQVENEGLAREQKVFEVHCFCLTAGGARSANGVSELIDRAYEVDRRLDECH